MQKQRALLFFVAGVIWLVLPFIVSAQIDIVVPQAPSGVSDTAFYDLCQLGQLMQNIINFLVGFALFIAVVLFAWAGFLYVTGGQNPAQITRAHSVFKNVLIGFLIAISAWLVVQTVISVIFNGTVFVGGNWSQLECSKNPRPMTSSVSQLINSVIPDVKAPTVQVSQTPVGAATYDIVCAQGSVYDPALRLCTNPEDGTRTPPLAVSIDGATYTAAELAAKVNATQPYAAELAQICAKEGYTDCATAQAIMAIESTGNPDVCSAAGACGLMQVMPATAKLLDPSLAGLSDAEIQAKLKDPTYNMTLGVQYIMQMDQQFDGANLIASYNGGPTANKASTTCPGQTYWSCTANSGYAETRSYVPNVQAAKNLITL